MTAPLVFPAGGAVSGRVTPATFPFYTTGEDNLRLVSYNTAAGVTLMTVARLLDSAGRPSPSSWPHTPNTDGTAKSDDFRLSGDTLLNVRVVATSGSPKMGQTYVELQLIRGSGLAAMVLGTVLAGYVTAGSPLAWPGSPIEHSLSGPGVNTNVKINLSLVGGEFLVTVPTGVRWEILGIRNRLVASGAAGARVPILQIVVSNGTAIEVVQPNSTGPAGTTDYSWAPGLMQTAALAVAGHSVTGFPIGLVLGPGDTLGSLTVNLDVNDRWGPGAIVYKQWLEP